MQETLTCYSFIIEIFFSLCPLVISILRLDIWDEIPPPLQKKANEEDMFFKNGKKCE